MKMVSGADDYCIDILLFIEKFMKVVVGRASFILPRTLPASVEAVDDLLRWFAAGDSAGHLEGMGQFDRIIGAKPVPSAVDAEQLANGIAELVGAPLRISRGTLIYVAHSHALHVSLAQEVNHHAQTLGTDSDESDVHLVAGRNVTGAAENVTRNYGEDSSCGRTFCQKFATR